VNLKIIFSLFILGLSFGSGPCLASCGPLLISYSAAGLKNIRDSLKTYLVFSLARILVYLCFAILVFFLGKIILEGFLRIFSRYILILGGVFIVFLGILMALGKKIQNRPWNILQKHITKYDKKSIFLLGVIIGFLPCAPLIFIFSYAVVVSKTLPETLLYTLSFGLGTFLSPLLLLSIAVGVFPRWLKEEKLRQVFSLICGVIIVFLGVQLIIRGI